MKTKKIILIFLCAVFLCGVFCSCKKNDETTTEAESTTSETTQEPSTSSNTDRSAVIGYYAADSLNPYKTKSRTNQTVVALLYDSLFRVNEKYEAVPSIAESIEIDGKKVTVSVKDSLSFSDGNAVTSSDVAYSYVLAKSSPLYSAQLSNVASCTDSGSTLVFTLSVPDVFVSACLDFPIVEKGSGKKSVPTGSGRYTLKKKNGEYFLSASKNSSSEEIMEQSLVKLLDLGSVENHIYLLRTGELSCFCDFDGEKSNIKTDAGVSKITLNNLVFLGMNSESDLLSSQKARQAISALVDRDEISASAYDSMAKSAFCVFNPDWEKCGAIASKSTAADSIKASSLLDEAGFSFNAANNEYRLTKDGNLVSLKLIVNKDDSRRVKAAKLIAERLKKGGISVESSVLSFEDYEEALSDGDYDLYLGEVRLSKNMDLSPFFSSAGKANYGINLKSPLCDAYFDFKEGKIDISTFESVFDGEVSFIPLCYRQGAVYYSRALSFEGSPNESDIYSNIYSWSF